MYFSALLKTPAPDGNLPIHGCRCWRVTHASCQASIDHGRVRTAQVPVCAYVTAGCDFADIIQSWSEL